MTNLPSHVGKASVPAVLYVAYVNTLVKQAGTHQRPWCTEESFFTDCHSREGIAACRSNGTGLKVIMPSYGQTGTSSVVMALRELGIRAFHVDDYCAVAKPVMFDGVDANTWTQTVTRCRMEAISLEPFTDMLPTAVAMSPGAKVILTWRSYPSYLWSALKIHGKEVSHVTIEHLLVRGAVMLQWIEKLDRLTGMIRQHRLQGNPYHGNFSPLAYLYKMECSGYLWPHNNVVSRGPYKGGGHEEAYLGHINEIRMLVPQERLLEFDVTHHSWDELEHFLYGRKSSRSGRPFPRARFSGMRTNDPVFERNLHITLWSHLFYTVVHMLNYTVFALAWTAAAGILQLFWQQP